MYDQNNQFPHPETTCGTLLVELQAIWDEVGEPESERDKMLLQLEQECLDVYRRKVDQASHIRARLRQAVAESEAEIALICATVGDRPIRLRKVEQNTVSLKKELEAIMPELEEMRKRKTERRNRFVEVLDRLNILSKEIIRSEKDNEFMRIIGESDLSLKRLEELQNQIRVLEKEKSDRLNLVLENLNNLNSLCVVLGVDFKRTIREIQPTLDESNSTKNIHFDTIEKLSAAISSFKEVKIQRIQKLQDLAGTMVELWTLMDTPFEEQKPFHNVTRHIADSENEFTEPNILSLDFINFAEAEVLRLQQMKLRKMKEVILKKRLDLEELCRKAHMVVEAHNTLDYSVDAIKSGTIDPSNLLQQIELWISKVKEEAFSRKDILEGVEKWLSACEEECWLEEYSRDDNRYNGGRGTHLMLKRAEKARVIVNKIPAMVDALNFKTRAWEEDRQTEFLYDGVGLISMLEQYNILKQEKEQERQRQRDRKKLYGLLVTEQEVLFGSKPSPVKSGRKVSRKSAVDTMSKRFTHVGVVLQTPPNGKITSSSHRKSNSVKQNSLQIHCAPSSGKKTLGITSLTAGQCSYIPSSAHVAETTPARKALSPVSSPYQLKVNAAGNTPVQNVTHNLVIPRTPPSNKSPVSMAYLDENRTPKTMPIPMPNTPCTVLVGMQTAPTPAPPPLVPQVAHDIGHSFEERRAGVLSSISSQG